jgi:hypothetical protein
MGSFAEKSENLTTQTNTPKFVEEVVAKVMQVNKAVELFQIGNYESKYEEFEYGGEQFKEQIGYRGEGEGNNIKRLG